MPRLGMSIDEKFDHQRAPRPDKYGRRVRYVNGVDVPNEKRALIDPLFLKLALGLTIIASVAMAVAIWRLFSFPH